MLKGQRLTDAIVGGIALIAGTVYIWKVLTPTWAVITICILLYEAFTLANKEPDDTISETIWRASDRSPLVPAAGFGLFVLALANGWIVDLHVVVPLAVLVGHFWFPRYGGHRPEGGAGNGEAK